MFMASFKAEGNASGDSCIVNLEELKAYLFA